MLAKLTRASYGGTAAIVTSMGLMVGLTAGRDARAAIVARLLVIAVADNLSDSLAIHMYQESENLEVHSAFRATVFNFVARLLIGSSFVVLALFLPFGLLVPVGLAWGLFLLGTITYQLARQRQANPLSEVAKHLALAAAVIVMSRIIGTFILRHIT